MSDHIERVIELNAPIERVWRALTDYQEFGTWFRLKLHAPFQTGEITTGEVTFPGHEGLPFWARVKAMEAPRYFSFLWPMDETVAPDDPNVESKVTLVEFTLEPLDAGGTEGAGGTERAGGAESPEGADGTKKPGTKLTLRESGWDAQMQNIKSHVA